MIVYRCAFCGDRVVVRNVLSPSIKISMDCLSDGHHTYYVCEDCQKEYSEYYKNMNENFMEKKNREKNKERIKMI